MRWFQPQSPVRYRGPAPYPCRVGCVCALMPWAAPTVCPQAGCGKLVAKPGYCEVHRAQAHRDYNVRRRGNNIQSDKWYHTSKWRKLRNAVIHEDPLCRMCKPQGRTTAAVLVDHIIPVKFGGQFWLYSNLQPLCNHCHELKSRSEGSRG